MILILLPSKKEFIRKRNGIPSVPTSSLFLLGHTKIDLFECSLRLVPLSEPVKQFSFEALQQHFWPKTFARPFFLFKGFD